MFRSIKWTLNDSVTNSAISEVTDIVDGQEKTLTDKDDVEQAILKANDKKYRQTNDTPLMSVLLPDFGFLGDNPTCRKILNDEYVPCQPIDSHTRAFIKELKRAPNIPTIKIEYSPNDYTQGWKKMEEYTTAGLSGIHFGHHKACATNHTLASFESQMSLIPYISGYPPERYKKVSMQCY